MRHDFFAYGGDAPGFSGDRNKEILKSLDDDDWDKLLSFGSVRRYQPDAVITAAGGDDRALTFVLAGAVKVSLSDVGPKSTKFKLLEEGNVFGLSSFLDGEPSGVEAVAQGQVELFMLSPQSFEQLAAWHPRIAITLLRDIGADLSSRLRKLNSPI